MKLFSLSVAKMMIAEGIAPIIGPKKGIRFVIPIITLIRSGKGQPNIVINIKQIIPTISEESKDPEM